MERLDKNDILSFGNEDYRYLLFELSYYNEPIGLNELIFKIKEKGLEIEDIMTEDADLEDVFIKLTKNL